MIRDKSQRKTVYVLVGIVSIMGGLGFASAPLYDMFCRVTGYGGTTQTAQAGDETVTVTDRTIRVTFDASRDRDMPWTFRPAKRMIDMKVGEQMLAFYTAYNPTNEPVAGSASYNVTPVSMGEYFVKIDCFCFEEQLLMPGQRVEMPVSFYIDPAMLDDKETQKLPEVTLSYTFHRIELTDEMNEELQQAAKAAATDELREL